MKTKAFGTIVVVLIMIIAAMLAVLTATLITSDISKVVDYRESQQAFYLAESGLAHVRELFASNITYRSNPTTVSEDLGQGNFSVAVAKSLDTYTLTSTGTAGQAKRMIEQTIVLEHSVFKYALALYDDAQDLTIKGSVDISGDIYYVSTGQLTINKDTEVVNGVVYCDNLNPSSTGAYTVAPAMPSPPSTYPAFDSTSYDNEITAAESLTSGDLILASGDSLALDGGTVYYSTATIKGTITGPGTIVTTGGVDLDGASISEDVTVISGGTLAVQGNTAIADRGVLFSSGNVTLSGNSQINGCILAPGSDVEAASGGNVTVNGIIYSDSIAFNGSVTVNGAVAANRYGESALTWLLTGNIAVNYNSSYVNNFLPAGFEGGAVTITSQGWEEL